MIPRRLLAAVPLACWMQAAAAEVTADQVWQSLRDAVAAEGATLSAQENRRGADLVLRRGQIDLGGGALLLLPDITLTDTPEGAVAVTLPPRFPLTLDLPPSPDDPDKVVLDVSAPDLVLTIRAMAAEAAAFDLTARSVTASLQPIVLPPGATKGPQDLFLALAVADLSLRHRHSAVAPDLSAESALSLGTVHAEARVDVPDERIKASMSMDLSKLAGKLTAKAPPGVVAALDEADQGGDPGLAAFIELLDQGLAVDLGVSHDALSFAFDAQGIPEGRMRCRCRPRRAG